MRWTLSLVLAVMIGLTASLSGQKQAHAGTVKVGIGDSKLVKLSTSPNVVVIGNPNIADVILEDNRIMFIIGLAVGQTSLHILDSSGTTIIRDTIVVGPSETNQVTVQRGPGNTQTMYCTEDSRCVARPGDRASGVTAKAGGGGNVGGGSSQTTQRAAPDRDDDNDG